MQVMLEGAAAAILKQLDTVLDWRDAGLGVISRKLLAQEEAHHRLGTATLASIAVQHANRAAWRHAAYEYACAASSVLHACRPLLHELSHDVIEYDPFSACPPWLR